MNQQGSPTIKFQCACGQWLEAPAANAGQSGKCRCGRTLTVPAANRAPASAAARAPQPAGVQAGTPLAGTPMPSGAMPGAVAPGAAARPPGLPGQVQCPSCGEWTQPGMICEWCSAPMAPPKPAAPAPRSIAQSSHLPPAAIDPRMVQEQFDRAEMAPPPRKVLLLVAGAFTAGLVCAHTEATSCPLSRGPSHVLIGALVTCLCVFAASWVYHQVIANKGPYIACWVLVCGCLGVAAFMKLNATMDGGPETTSVTVVTGRYKGYQRRGVSYYLYLSPWVDGSRHAWYVTDSMYDEVPDGERFLIITKPGAFGIKWMKGIRRPSTGDFWSG